MDERGDRESGVEREFQAPEPSSVVSDRDKDLARAISGFRNEPAFATEDSCAVVNLSVPSLGFVEKSSDLYPHRPYDISHDFRVSSRSPKINSSYGYGHISLQMVTHRRVYRWESSVVS